MTSSTLIRATLPDGGSKVELLVNDLSIHGQFPDVPTFRSAIGRIMAIREVARRFGSQLHCHRNISNTNVTKELSMFEATVTFPRNEKRALILWLTQLGGC